MLNLDSLLKLKKGLKFYCLCDLTANKTPIIEVGLFQFDVFHFKECVKMETLVGGTMISNYCMGAINPFTTGIF